MRERERVGLMYASYCPWRRGESKWSRGNVLRLLGKNYQELVNECMKGYTDPFNGSLCSMFHTSQSSKNTDGRYGTQSALGQEPWCCIMAKSNAVKDTGKRWKINSCLSPASAVHPCLLWNHLSSPEMTIAASSCSFFPPIGLTRLPLGDRETPFSKVPP